MLTRFAADAPKGLSGDDTTHYLDILNRNLDIYFAHFSPGVPWIEYFLRETDGDARDLFLSWSLHEFIDDNYLDVAKCYLATYKASVRDGRLKSRILGFYGERLKALETSRLTAESKIRTVPKDAGDSLLQKITAPYAGKVVYVDFWGTWCGPCIAEMPNAAKLRDELEGQEVVFLYLGVRSTERTWRQLIAKLNIKGEHYLLNDQEYKLLERKLGINGIPHYVLLDRRGNIKDPKAVRPGDPTLKNRITALVEDK